MMTTTPTVVSSETRSARLAQPKASRVLARVKGRTAVDAIHALEFSADMVCPEVARLIRAAVGHAAREHNLKAGELAVVSYEVGDGDPITRVRRHSHGHADWITTETAAIRVDLSTMPYPVRKD